MQVRRVCAAAGAVTINLLAAAGLLSMTPPATHPPPLPEPIFARLIERPKPPTAAVEPIRALDRALAGREAAAREATDRRTTAPSRAQSPEASHRLASTPAARAPAIDGSAVASPAVASPANDRLQSGPPPTAMAVAGAATRPARSADPGLSDPPVPGAAEPSDRAAVIPATGPAAERPAPSVVAGAVKAAALPAPGAPRTPSPGVPDAAPTEYAGAFATGGPARHGPRIDASWTGNVAPPYPGTARRLGEQGEVRLDVHVGADGTVLEVRLRASSGSTTLDRSAIDTVRRWRFTPARVDGQAIDAWYRDWTWTFRLEG